MGILDHNVPMPAPGAHDFYDKYDHRKKLAELLGVGGDWRTLFESGALVVAPLITALISTAVPT